MKGKKFWEFKAANRVGELLLYGPVSDFSWWGDEVTPRQFKEEMDALGDIDELKVFINSGGGDVFAGQAIHSMLKRHSATVTVYIDGLAASIASVIAMAGNRVVMPRNAMMMIHNPWTFAFGDSNEFRKMADELDKVRESLVAAYEDKTRLSPDYILELMDAETWMTAEEAVAEGFADEIEASKQVAASLDGRTLIVNGERVDLARYRHPPKLAFLPGPEPHSSPAPIEIPKALEAIVPPDKPILEPENSDKPTNIGERQWPLSFYAQRSRVRRNERRVVSR